jgi:hypothetical protein
MYLINRRQILAAVLSCAFVLTGTLASVSAQSATPAATPGASPLANLGLPALAVTITDSSYEGIPSQLAAGRYLLTVTNSTTNDLQVGFAQPVGVTTDEFLSVLSQYAAGNGSPATLDGTPTTAAEQNGAPPAWFYNFKLAGGVGVSAGQTSQAVIDLLPGSWVAWGDDPTAAQQPFVFQATGEMPANLPEPQSSATIGLTEYSITITAGALTTGEQILDVKNIGAQPHFLVLVKVPDGTTRDDIGQLINSEMTGTPAAIPLNPETDFQDVASTDTQSAGTSSWIAVNLQPGTYAVMCFFPDEASGMPHASMGMYNVFTVSA